MHVALHITSDGKKVVSVHATKKAAHEAGMAIRKAGGTAYAFSADHYKKFVDPSFNADEYHRDSQGRFAAK